MALVMNAREMVPLMVSVSRLSWKWRPAFRR